MSEAFLPAVVEGDVIGDAYVVEHTLGCGGMGMVVAARHVVLGAPRALKVPYASTDGYDAVAERFDQEAAIAAQLGSEHVVRTYAGGRLPSGAPYIVMERLEGGDLGALLRRRRRLPAAEAVLYLTHACSAMTEAHARGILHLDLKPANLFLTARPDGSPCVKVLDFGIAQRMGAGASGKAHAEGSVGYMAPEQVLSREPLGPAADVWALGVTLYELLTGKLPFCGGTPACTIVLAMTQDPIPPEAHRPSLPTALSDIVLRCLEKTPARRFRDAGELLAALAPFLVPGACGEDADTGADAPADPGADAARAGATTRPLAPAPTTSCGATARSRGWRPTNRTHCLRSRARPRGRGSGRRAWGS